MESAAKVRHGRPYVVLEDLWPHDGNVREWVSGSRLKVARSLGLRPRVLARDSGISTGISAVRSMLPLVEWNERPIPLPGETVEEARDRMRIGMDCVRQYRRKYDPVLKRYQDEPLHDWCSDAADALRCMARGRKERYPGIGVVERGSLVGPHGEGLDGGEYALTD